MYLVKVGLSENPVEIILDPDRYGSSNLGKFVVRIATEIETEPWPTNAKCK